MPVPSDMVAMATMLITWANCCIRLDDMYFSKDLVVKVASKPDTTSDDADRVRRETHDVSDIVTL